MGSQFSAIGEQSSCMHGILPAGKGRRLGVTRLERGGSTEKSWDPLGQETLLRLYYETMETQN